MINGSSRLERDLNDLERSVSAISSQINNAGVIWRDSKFYELKSNIAEFASSTSSVLRTGRECCKAINDFQRISEGG